MTLMRPSTPSRRGHRKIEELTPFQRRLLYALVEHGTVEAACESLKMTQRTVLGGFGTIGKEVGVRGPRMLAQWTRRQLRRWDEKTGSER